MQFVAAILVALVGVVAFFFILVPLLRVIGRLIAHIFRFIGSEIGDVLRVLGGVLTSVVFAPLVVLSVIIGRWSAARHYGAAIQDEVAAVGFSIYRIFIGNPARLLGLTALTDGIEHRVPEAMAKAPGRDKPRRAVGQFDGYKIVGSIAGGGSGARLYVAEPDDIKRAAFERQGLEVDQVVIKSFSLKEGSSLPQIIREGRALEAAKKIGLVLEHDLTDQRFFYVMPYVPGDALGIVTQRMHDAAGGDGLDNKRLSEAIGYVSDLLSTLERYHRAGLWHKDVKPDNIIVHDGRAHVVDLGLVTPLRSAMTLTTHGTEYFRDPELVRMALKGVKVHEVNGVKFDVYAAGAVLYSAIENSFPAHGGLSHLTKRCPDAVRWIIRRSMTDYNNRYNSASEMMADLDAVRLNGDMFAMRPADLPSMNGKPAPVMAEAPDDAADFAAAQATPVAHVSPTPDVAAPAAQPAAQPAARGPRKKPKIREVHWLTGRYVTDGGRVAGGGGSVEEAIAAGFGAGGERVVRTPRVPRERRAPASEQLQRARQRADAARRRAHSRVRDRSRHRRYNNSPNRGVFMSVFVFLIFFGAIAGVVIKKASEESRRQSRLVLGHPGGGDGPNVQMQFTEKDLEDVREFLAEEWNIDTRDLDAEGVHEFATAIEDRVSKFVERFAGQIPGARSGSSSSRNAPVTIAVAEDDTSESRIFGSTGDLDGQRWIVLSDVGESADASQRAAVDRLIEALQDAGSDVVDRNTDDPAAIDLLASIRATLGTVQAGDPEATQRILGWLSERATALDGLLWLPAPTGRDVTVQVFSPDESAERSARRVLQRVAR